MYYKLYSYLTTLVRSQTESIDIAMTPHSFGLTHNLNMTRSDTKGFLPSDTREVRMECAFHSGTQPYPPTPVLLCERLFELYSWRHLCSTLPNLLGFFLAKTLLNYLCEELFVAFIRLADLIINLDCIAAVRFSTYTSFCDGKDIPIVNICLTIPEGSLDSASECCLKGCDNCGGIEKLEFESDLALAIWDYFTKSTDVTVLFE